MAAPGELVVPAHVMAEGHQVTGDYVAISDAMVTAGDLTQSLADWMEYFEGSPISGPVLAESFQSEDPTGSQAIVFAGANSRSNSWLFGQLSLSGTVTNDATFGVAGAAYIRVSPDTMNASAASPFAYFGVDARAGTGRQGTRSGVRARVLVNGTCNVAETYPAVAGVQGFVGISTNQNGTTGAATNYIGAIFGGNFNVDASSGATFINLVCGTEFDVQVRTGASVAYKLGLTVVKTALDAVRGVYSDAAIQINDQDGAASTWLHGIEFGAYSHLWPFGADSTLIGATPRTIPAPASAIALHGVNFTNVTFQSGGSAFKSTGFKVDPSGNTTIANPVDPGWTSGDERVPYGVGSWGDVTLSTSAQVTAFPFYSEKPITISAVNISLTTAQAGAACRIGIYTNNGSGRPGSLITDYGELDLSATTGKRTLSASAAVQGVFWVLVWVKNVATQVTVRGPSVYTGLDLPLHSTQLTSNTTSTRGLLLASAYPASMPSTAPAVVAHTGASVPLPTVTVA